ncbi:MAG: hypothetical protein HYZ50_04030 [Deltaproteobacteria bacterium]|nr:hypothetical protein [Deltaproteobacteria bacterium]
MLQFYFTLLAKAGRRFRQIMTTWRFWIGFVVLGATTLFLPRWSQSLNFPNLSGWYILVPVGLLILYCLLKANYEWFDELQNQIKNYQKKKEEEKDNQEQKRTQQHAVDQVAQLRAEAVQELYAKPLHSDQEVGGWLVEHDLWSKKTADLLSSYFTAAVALRFSNLGKIPNESHGHALNASHRHGLQILSKQLDILEEIVKAHDRIFP